MKITIFLSQFLLIAFSIGAARDPFSLVQNVALQQSVGGARYQTFLVATVSGSCGKRAIINYQGETFFVGVGEMIGEKKVIAIEEDRIVLGSAGASSEITFLDF